LLPTTQRLKPHLVKQSPPVLTHTTWRFPPCRCVATRTIEPVRVGGLCNCSRDFAVRYGRGSPAHKSGVFIRGFPPNKKTTATHRLGGFLSCLDALNLEETSKARVAGAHKREGTSCSMRRSQLCASRQDSATRQVAGTE
jgi:hypothetical protein